MRFAELGGMMIVRRWIDVSALLTAGVVLPVGIIAVAFVLSRGDNGDAAPPPTPPTMSSVPSPSSTTTVRDVPEPGTETVRPT